MEESQGDRLARKIRQEPLLPVGVGGCLGALLYGAYKYKHRGDMSTSFFLVQLRVASQGMVIGALCISIIYSGGKRIYNHLNKD